MRTQAQAHENPNRKRGHESHLLHLHVLLSLGIKLLVESEGVEAKIAREVVGLLLDLEAIGLDTSAEGDD